MAAARPTRCSPRPARRPCPAWARSSAPSAGRTENVRSYAWTAGIGVSLTFVAVMVAWGRCDLAGGVHKGSSTRQAAVLAVAAGSTFGLTAALMKGMASTYAQGFGALFASWQLYGMIAVGLLGMFLVQSAMNAGRLIAAQPGLTLSDPIVSVMWGVLVFRERLHRGWFIVPAVASGLVMVFAVIMLARSPLLSDPAGRQQGPERAGSGQKRAARGAPRGAGRA